MKPVFLTALRTFFSLSALSNAFGAGSDEVPVPRRPPLELMNRIHAAWRASTEWIERAATTSGR